MEGKTDMVALISTLERVCIEYDAMKTILMHDNPDRWVNDVRRLAAGPGPRNRTADVFHGVNENLQSGQGDDVLVAALIDALEYVALVPPEKK